MFELINGDCIEIMKSDRLQGYRFNLLLTDPPYNISRETNFHTLRKGSRFGMNFGEWDKDFNLVGWIPYATKFLNENANVIIFSCWENLGTIAGACRENNITIKRCLTLNKTNPAPFNRDRMFVNSTEFALWGIYHSTNKPKNWIFNRKQPIEKSVINTTVQNTKYHPNMKDVKVITRLIEILSNVGDWVFDPFMGSGTTGVSCKENGRNFVGIELDETYYNTSKTRIMGRV